jgi:hypothetical protein
MPIRNSRWLRPAIAAILNFISEQKT